MLQSMAGFLEKNDASKFKRGTHIMALQRSVGSLSFTFLFLVFSSWLSFFLNDYICSREIKVLVFIYAIDRFVSKTSKICITIPTFLDLLDLTIYRLDGSIRDSSCTNPLKRVYNLLFPIFYRRCDVVEFANVGSNYADRLRVD